MVVDVEVGLLRTGASPDEQAYQLALTIENTPLLHFVGLQGYAGHLMHVPDRAERERSTLAAMRTLGDVRDELRRRNLAPGIVTGGGTGSFDLDPAANVLTEIQVAVGVFS